MEATPGMALLRKPKPVSGREETPRTSSSAAALTQSPLEVTQPRLPPIPSTHGGHGGPRHGPAPSTHGAPVLYPCTQRFWRAPALLETPPGMVPAAAGDILSVEAMGKATGVSVGQRGAPQVGEGDTGLVARSASGMAARN